MALQPSGSLLFPFQYDNENNCLKRATTIEDVLLSCIRCFLLTKKGSRVGSNIGSFLPELVLQTISTSQLLSLAGELKQELEDQFQGVDFISVVLQRGEGTNITELVVSIQFSVINQNNIVNLTLSLPSVFASGTSIQTSK